MQQLRELLELAVGASTFDVGLTEYRLGGTTSTSYAQRPGEVIESHEFCEIMNANLWNSQFVAAQSAKLIVPEEFSSPVYDFLHDLLEEYIDAEAGKIGHAFPVNGRGSYESHSSSADGVRTSAFISEVEDVTHALIRGAAVLGAKRVSDLVRDWLEGHPVEYSSSALINGLYIDEQLLPLDGVQINSLPCSTNILPGNLPRIGGLSQSDYIGRTVASLDTVAMPAFLHPSNVNGDNSVKAVSTSDLGFPQLFKALSLIENSNVEPAFFWSDYLELSTFRLSPQHHTWSFANSGLGRSLPIGTSHKYDFDNGVDSVVLPEESIANIDIGKLRNTLSTVKDLTSREINLAIERWSRSKRSMSSLEDSFIDLRIALEALYLKDFANENSQEMRFRLALFGAWYVGESFEERKDIRKILRTAYDRASGVVHGGHLEIDESNRELLSGAQDLCRRGILKLIEDGIPSAEEWGNLVLGWHSPTR